MLNKITALASVRFEKTGLKGIEVRPIDVAITPDADKSSPQNLDKTYAEASQWIRMSNSIVWQMASVFIPGSVGCIGLALAYPPYLDFFAIASTTLFGIWVFVSALYRQGSIDARTALINIERFWGIPIEMAPYTRQGQIGMRRYSLMRVQIVALAGLFLFWLVFWLIVRTGPPKLH